MLTALPALAHVPVGGPQGPFCIRFGGWGLRKVLGFAPCNVYIGVSPKPRYPEDPMDKSTLIVIVPALVVLFAVAINSGRSQGAYQIQRQTGEGIVIMESDTGHLWTHNNHGWTDCGVPPRK